MRVLEGVVVFDPQTAQQGAQMGADGDAVTVLVVDDHTVAREGLRAMLETEPQVQVVGEAADGQEAVDRVAELRPQVVLMDMRMPRMDGLEATRRIKIHFPTTSVIMMTSYDDDALVIDSVRVGAAGYLLKDSSRTLLHHCISAAIGGGILIKAALLQKALIRLTVAPPQTAEEAKIEKLSERELAMLKMMAEGATNKAIADALCLAEVTVKKHVQSIIAKLRASDRTHAAIIGVRLGLIQ